MLKRPRYLILAALLAIAAPLAVYSVDAAPKPHKANAQLKGGGAKGEVRYVKQKKSGKTYESFKVKVKRGLPLQMHSVRVNGKTYGYLMTGLVGNGTFELRSAQFVNSNANGVYPIPKNFPRLRDGDVVKVGGMKAKVQCTTDGNNGDDDDDSADDGNSDDNNSDDGSDDDDGNSDDSSNGDDDSNDDDGDSDDNSDD